MSKNFFEILEVEQDATLAEINKAYRRLAFEFHPDRNPGNEKAEEKFREVAKAFDVLSNPEKRAEYTGELKEALTDTPRDTTEEIWQTFF